MKPLRVRAHVSQSVAFKGGVIALDSLLIKQKADALRLPPPTVQLATTGQLTEIEIPIQKSACGRLYLSSHAYPKIIESETRHKRRRFPAEAALRISDMNRIDQGAGAQKSYNIPFSAGFIDTGFVEWFCVGDRDPMHDLLAGVTHLGAYHGNGLGAVDRWQLEEIETWDGFPLVRDSQPLRPLPMGWPGLAQTKLGYATVMPPYYDRHRNEPCWMP